MKKRSMMRGLVRLIEIPYYATLSAIDSIVPIATLGMVEPNLVLRYERRLLGIDSKYGIIGRMYNWVNNLDAIEISCSEANTAGTLEISHRNFIFSIVFEGIDGSSKSSQSRKLYQELSKDYEVILLGEPGSTELGSRIREILLSDGTIKPMTRLMLYLASMVDAVELLRVISKPTIVIWDRFYHSTMAYNGMEVDEDTINDLLIYSGIYKYDPDMLFLLDLPADIAIGRKHVLDVVEEKGLEYLSEVRKRYLELYAGDEGTTVVDATQDPDVIANTIEHMVRRKLESWVF